MNSISDYDLELRLLRGYPFEIEKVCLIYPATLEEIVQVGYEKYFKLLNLLTLSQSEIEDYLKKNNDDSSLTTLEFLIKSSSANSTFKLELEQAFNTFIREDKITILPNERMIVLGELEEQRFIDNEIFSQIQKILRVQNCVSVNEVAEDNSMQSKRAREIAAKLNRGKQLVQQSKKDNLSLADLISAFAAKSTNLNILDVWKLPYYTFNDQFKRIQLIDNYDINLRSIMAGADAKKIELKHWMTKIQENN